MSELNNDNGLLINPKHRSIRFIGCGGTAINLLRSYKLDHPKHGQLLANELFTYIDTSIANLHGAEQRDAFILKGLEADDEIDGSGGNRAANAAKIMEAMPEIMLHHGTADFFVVVFSASGGTGSTAGPMILERLLQDGKRAIAIVIGSAESTRRSRNVIGTISGMELTVQRVKRPVVMHFTMNDRKKSFADNNTRSLFAMGALSMLVSGKNRHLDTSDWANAFDYQNTTHHQPALSMLDIYADENDLVSNSKNLISLAILHKSHDDVYPDIEADYDTVGYMPENVTGYNNSFFYTVSTDGLKDLKAHLKSLRDQLDKQKAVTNQVSSLTNSETKVDTATGLVFD